MLQDDYSDGKARPVNFLTKDIIVGVVLCVLRNLSECFFLGTVSAYSQNGILVTFSEVLLYYVNKTKIKNGGIFADFKFKEIEVGL